MTVIEPSLILKLSVTAVFQQMEVDYIIGRPNKDVHVTDLTDVPIIRMYGVTESGIRTPREGMHLLHCMQLQVVSHATQLMHYCRK